MHDRKCPECGAAFTPRYGSQVCCSQECQKKRHRRYCAAYCAAYRKAKQNALKRDPQRFADAFKLTTPVTQEVLMQARRKPANCSDVRWRIELRRRANSAYYNLFGGRC